MMSMSLYRINPWGRRIYKIVAIITILPLQGVLRAPNIENENSKVDLRAPLFHLKILEKGVCLLPFLKNFPKFLLKFLHMY